MLAENIIVVSLTKGSEVEAFFKPVLRLQFNSMYKSDQICSSLYFSIIDENTVNGLVTQIEKKNRSN